MVTTVRSLGLNGIAGYEVTAECFLSGGLPAFDIVGLPDAAVREATFWMLGGLGSAKWEDLPLLALILPPLFLVLMALARPLNAMLMGDSWLQTILRVVTPNALSSLIEVFSYYFINSMVTISALIYKASHPVKERRSIQLFGNRKEAVQ